LRLKAKYCDVGCIPFPILTSFLAAAAVHSLCQDLDSPPITSVVALPPWSNAVVLFSDALISIFENESDRSVSDEVIHTLVAGSPETPLPPPQSLHFFVDNLVSATAAVRVVTTRVLPYLCFLILTALNRIPRRLPGSSLASFVKFDRNVLR